MEYQRYYIINQVIYCQKKWAVSSAYIIDDVHNYNDETNDLCLIILFRDTY